MKKFDFIELLKSIVSGSKNVFRDDKPAIRWLFNDTKDTYHKEGRISDGQVQNWILTDRELKQLIKISKG